MSSDDDEHPLTCGQRWLLHVAERAPDLAKPVQRIYKLPAPVDTAGLLAAYRRVVGGEPALRMRLLDAPGGVRQRFPASPVTLSGLSIRGATRAHRDAYLRKVLLEHGRALLDLRADPPVSAKLFELDGEHVLSLCIDHVAADDLGFDRAERLLARACAGETAEGPPPADDHPYLAYLQREALQREVEASNLAFWREHLAGAPLSRHRSERAWVAGRLHRWGFGGDTLTRFLRVCRARMCSPTAAVVAALAGALGKIGETDDLVVNVPVSNRARAADHGIVGNLSMLLHLRVRLDPDELASERLRRVQRIVLDAMAHRQYDYASLSAHVADEAEARGGEVGLGVGCSYVLQRDDDLGPRLERMDTSGQPFDVPGGSFSLSCRQRSAAVELTAEWDPEAWPVQGSAFARLHLDDLARALATADLFAAVDVGQAP
jgi:hypothetical protein